MVTGREAIEQSLRGDFKNRPDARLMVSVDQVRALGRDAALAAGPFTVTVPGNEFHGNFALVFEREGEAWKLRLSTFTRQINPSGVVAPALR
jgi:SnoaL-like domain